MGKSLLAILIFAPLSLLAQINVGSKNFPESHVLAEIIAQTIEQNTNLTVERKFGLGGTLICAEAVRAGNIDIYPEYTGTALITILKEEYNLDQAEAVYSRVEAGLANTTIQAGPQFGFSNTYVLAARSELGLSKISDLDQSQDIRFGFSNEFINRPDGFHALAKHYGFSFDPPRGMDHGLAYAALNRGQIDITDAYSTDGKLSQFKFTLLEDDKRFFPPYQAFPIIHSKTAQAYPEIVEALALLENAISTEQMQLLNYQYEVEKTSAEVVAYTFLKEKGIVKKLDSSRSMHPILYQTLTHIELTLIATLLAVIIAIPLGIFIVRYPKLAGVVMSATGAVQTIPSLALLGFMIPLFGIGFTPAIIALLLYALLPILRNTYTGLTATDPLLIEAGRAMGMTEKQILIQVRLPLATYVIMAGVRTAFTINIGTATLAAFIGAGGLGESIITGITLNDHNLILQGAIPATLLAIISDQIMAWVQKKAQPKGLQKINESRTEY